MRISLLVSLLLLCVLSLDALAQAPENVSFEPDIVYGTVGGVDLKLNLSRPKNASGKLPCIVVIHGGGWRAGDRSAHNNITWNLAQQGLVSVTVGYRFAPQHPFPAQVQDVKCAVRFLRANAEKYNIDPERIGAVGFSAGAHLSMMLGAMDPADGLDDSGGSPGQSSKVQAVVAYFGPTDFTLPFPDASRNIVRDFLKEDGNVEVQKKASPVTYVNAGDAPMLLFQGTKDILVPHEHAWKMVEALTRAGVHGRVELLIGAGHGWGGAEIQRTLAAMQAFFREQLKGTTGR